MMRSRAADSAGMVLLKGASFAMGSDRHYPEEAPVRRVSVDAFWIDATPVTNAQFARFVQDSGYLTLAEIPPDPAQYPDMLPGMGAAGSLVFVRPAGPVSLADPMQWWRFEFGACWRRPFGHGSKLDGRDDHPVVHIAFQDAQAYCEWAGKSLPTEAQWEYAARGGRADAEYAWGHEFEPAGRRMANYWQGRFPWENTSETQGGGTTAVGSFPPNDFGLYDVIGNVWEWTTDHFVSGPARAAGASSCCVANRTEIDAVPKVLKGGSHLCAPNYCRRYRPAARYAQPADTSTSHVGFRCVRNLQ